MMGTLKGKKMVEKWGNKVSFLGWVVGEVLWGGVGFGLGVEQHGEQ
jgi:hypothetical protein